MTIAHPPRPIPMRPAAPNAPAGTGRASSIDPFRVLRRHMLLISASVFVGAGIGLGAYLALKIAYPLYQGQAVFRVTPGLQDAGGISTGDVLRDDDVERMAATEVNLIVSRSVIDRAVRKTGLQSSNWFRSNYGGISGGGLDLDGAAEDLEDTLSAGMVRGTQLFMLTWNAHDEKDAKLILDDVAAAYLEIKKADDDALYKVNQGVFQTELDETDRKIRDLDSEIEIAIRDAGITSLEDVRYTQAAQATQTLTFQISQAEAQLSVARSTLRQVQAKLQGTIDYSADDLQQAELNFAVAAHIQMEERLKVEYQASLAKFNPGHRAVLELQARLAAAAAEKKAKTEEVIRSNLNSMQRTLSYQIESTQDLIQKLRDDLAEKDATLTQLAGDQSKVEALRDRRSFLEVQRDADLGLLKNLKLMRLRADASRVRWLDQSSGVLTPRELYFPRWEITIPLGVFLIVGLTIAVVFVRELTDQRVKTAADLEIVPGANILGVVPDIEDDPTRCKEPEGVIRKYPGSILAESYRQTTTPVLEAMDRSGHQSLVLVGGLPGAGTTTAVINLAESMAAMSRRVLVVDANFRRPRLAEAFGASNDQAGLGDYLDDAVTIDEVIANTDSGVCVVSAGTPASRVFERLNTERLDTFVAEARDKFDLVMFDAPPAVVAGDAMVLAKKLDAAMLVVRANQEHRGLVSRLIRQFARSRAELLGVLLNRPRGTAGGYFKKNFAAMAEYTG